MRSSIDKVTLIICTNVTPKANFLTSAVAETSYGYYAEGISLQDSPEAILWADFEVNLNFGP